MARGFVSLEDVKKRDPGYYGELMILKRFASGGVIRNEKERGVLEKYYGLKFVHFSPQVDGTPTAKLTERGLRNCDIFFDERGLFRTAMDTIAETIFGKEHKRRWAEMLTPQ